MDNLEIPRGRATSILLLALMTFATFVLMVVPFLSQHSKYHISFIIVYVWETVLFVLALVSMVLLIILRNNRDHLIKSQTLNTKQSAIRCIFFVLLAASASILPFYESKQTSTCFDVEDQVIHRLQFASYLLIGIYTCFHSIFAPLCYQYRCKSFRARILVVIILSANASLFGNCILNTFRSLNTQPSQYPWTKINITNGSFELQAPDKNSSRYYFSHTLVYSFCKNGTEKIDRSSTTNEIHKYTYPLLIELVLISLTVLVPLWNIMSHRRANTPTINADVANSNPDDTIDDPEQDQEHNDRQSLVSSGSFEMYTPQRRVVNSLKRATRFVSQYSIVFSSIFAVTVLTLHILVEIGNDASSKPVGNTDKNLTSYDVEYYYLQTVYTYVISIVPFIGYFIVRQQHDRSTWRFDVDTALLFVGGCGHILLVIFETVDSITVLINQPTTHLTEDVMYFIKILFHYVGIYFQVKIILKASCPILDNGAVPDQKVHVKGIIIFLGICNFERYIADGLMPPTVLKFANDIQGDDTFGHVNWWIIVQTLFPVVIFYRLWSALMCFKVYDKLKRQ